MLVVESATKELEALAQDDPNALNLIKLAVRWGMTDEQFTRARVYYQTLRRLYPHKAKKAGSVLVGQALDLATIPDLLGYVIALDDRGDTKRVMWTMRLLEDMREDERTLIAPSYDPSPTRPPRVWSDDPVTELKALCKGNRVAENVVDGVYRLELSKEEINRALCYLRILYRLYPAHADHGNSELALESLYYADLDDLAEFLTFLQDKGDSPDVTARCTALINIMTDDERAFLAPSRVANG